MPIQEFVQRSLSPEMSSSQPGDRLDDEAVKQLQAIAQLCRNPALPSQQQWEHLYALTIHVHHRGLPLTARTVREYLTRQGCSFQKANWASGEYRRFVELLTVYDKKQSHR